MTIELTGSQFEEQFQEADQEAQRDPSDKLDVTCKFDAQISRGQRRRIYLRKGLLCDVDIHQLQDSLRINYREKKRDWVKFQFFLSGEGQDLWTSSSNENFFPVSAGKHLVIGNGVEPQSLGDYSDMKPHSRLTVGCAPSMLYSFVSSTDKELPKNLQHLTRSLNEEVYCRSGGTQPVMATVLQQILQCPYQGMVKRAYLESKTIELVALVLDHEITIQQGEGKPDSLKPEQLERIHYAKEILLRDLSNPPTLERLAHQAGLNDFLLKKGFRQVFGTTVFGELQTYRLGMAKQLLAEQDISVSKVAHLVGYASRSSFSKSFKHRFGVSPKQYQKECR